VSVAGDHSRPFAERIRACLARDRYDLLVCDFVQPSINIDDRVDIPVLLFQHNVESMIFERHALTASNAPLRWFWRAQWRKMERFEREACQRFGGVVAVSEADRAIFTERFGARRTFAIPTAVDADYFRPAAGPVTDGHLVFTGSMDWLPNEDAMTFFCRDVLPLIRAEEPRVTLSIVGRAPTPAVRALANDRGVLVTGTVDDVRPHVGKAAVYVVPLRIGGGTRLKIFEAMAMGKAVVSTAVGSEGLPVVHDQHLLIADRPREFADAVLSLLRDGGRRQRLEAAARSLVVERYDWSAVAGQLDEALTHTAQLLQRPSRAEAPPPRASL
jgi:glycosyltransferase involved in cell wall biosynthesis